MEKATVLVTGGSGFIGSNISVCLVEKGHEVRVIDNLSTGRLSNIEYLLSKPNFQFFNGSINDEDLLREAMEGVDYVSHQAAIPSVPRSMIDPFITNESGIKGTLNVLISAKNNNVKKVVCASSSSVYGDTPTLPKIETMCPNPKSPYAVSKLALEHYCSIFQENYDLNCVCLRYFNVYGPHQDPKSDYAAVIPIFIRKAIAGENLLTYGDGEQTRDFTFVQDVVQANIKALDSENNGVYNIACNRRITINELAANIIHIVGSDSVILHGEERPGDIKHSLANIDKARSELDYDPVFTMEEGLRQTVKHIMGELDV